MKGNEWLALVALPAAGAMWLWQAGGAFAAPWSAVGLLALTAALALAWLGRARAARRHFAALDVYAERELARARRQRRARQRPKLVNRPNGRG
jgi:hypothetical protein